MIRPLSRLNPSTIPHPSLRNTKMTSSSVSDTSPGNSFFPQTPPMRLPSLSFLYRLECEVAQEIAIGAPHSAGLVRVACNIISGTVQGPRIEGTVLPGGADWAQGIEGTNVCKQDHASLSLLNFMSSSKTHLTSLIAGSGPRRPLRSQNQRRATPLHYRIWTLPSRSRYSVLTRGTRARKLSMVDSHTGRR